MSQGNGNKQIAVVTHNKTCEREKAGTGKKDFPVMGSPPSTNSQGNAPVFTEWQLQKSCQTSCHCGKLAAPPQYVNEAMDLLRPRNSPFFALFSSSSLSCFLSRISSGKQGPIHVYFWQSCNL